MSTALVATVILLAYAVFMAWLWAVIINDLGTNPLRWRSVRAQAKADERAQRIAGLEHDLGYTCDRDDCYRCRAGGWSIYRNIETNAALTKRGLR